LNKSAAQHWLVAVKEGLYCGKQKIIRSNNVNFIKGWLPRCRALTFIVVALLVGNLWGFTTDKESTIDGDLTLNGVVKKTGCKSGYSLSGSLCIGSSQSSEAMYEAIDSCGDLHARVCTMQDMVYACQNGYTDGELLESGRGPWRSQIIQMLLLKT